MTEDRCVTIVPYLRVHNGRMQEFKALSERFVEKSKSETGCLYYGWSFNGDTAFCREGYKDAEAALAHLENVSALLAELAKITDVMRFEFHGMEAELAKLRGPLADLKADFFVLESGFRR